MAGKYCGHQVRIIGKQEVYEEEVMVQCTNSKCNQVYITHKEVSCSAPEDAEQQS